MDHKPIPTILNVIYVLPVSIQVGDHTARIAQLENILPLAGPHHVIYAVAVVLLLLLVMFVFHVHREVIQWKAEDANYVQITHSHRASVPVHVQSVVRELKFHSTERDAKNAVLGFTRRILVRVRSVLPVNIVHFQVPLSVLNVNVVMKPLPTELVAKFALQEHTRMAVNANHVQSIQSLSRMGRVNACHARKEQKRIHCKQAAHYAQLVSSQMELPNAKNARQERSHLLAPLPALPVDVVMKLMPLTQFASLVFLENTLLMMVNAKHVLSTATPHPMLPVHVQSAVLDPKLTAIKLGAISAQLEPTQTIHLLVNHAQLEPTHRQRVPLNASRAVAEKKQ